MQKMKEAPKLLHAYLRHKKQFRSSVGPLKLSSGCSTDDPKQMADAFVEAFASTFTADAPPNPVPHQHCDAVLDCISFTCKDVEFILAHLDVNTVMGPDGLHPQLLRGCATSLSYPLHKIFQLSMAEGSLPSLWKLSHVVPIFKKGSRSDPLNYRPVSLLSVPSKCLERLIFQGLHSRVFRKTKVCDTRRAQVSFTSTTSEYLTIVCNFPCDLPIPCLIGSQVKH